MMSFEIMLHKQNLVIIHQENIQLGKCSFVRQHVLFDTFWLHNDMIFVAHVIGIYIGL